MKIEVLLNTSIYTHTKVNTITHISFQTAMDVLDTIRIPNEKVDGKSM